MLGSAPASRKTLCTYLSLHIITVPDLSRELSPPASFMAKSFITRQNTGPDVLRDLESRL